MTRINGVDIQSVAFAPGQVEITYAEERDGDSPTGIMEIRTLVVPVAMVEEATSDVLDSIQHLVDAALIAKRNPRAVLGR